jgi:hypothetical protein
METLFEKLGRWRDERNRISALSYEAQNIRDLHRPLIETAKSVSRDAFGGAIAEMQFELQIPEYEIDRLETSMRLREARRWGVPLPDRPNSGDSDDYWDYCYSMGDHVLSVKGHKYLRREIANEREIFQKPFLSWAAICISVVSLVVSALNSLF